MPFAFASQKVQQAEKYYSFDPSNFSLKSIYHPNRKGDQGRGCERHYRLRKSETLTDFLVYILRLHEFQ